MGYPDSRVMAPPGSGVIVTFTLPGRSTGWSLPAAGVLCACWDNRTCRRIDLAPQGKGIRALPGGAGNGLPLDVIRGWAAGNLTEE